MNCFAVRPKTKILIKAHKVLQSSLPPSSSTTFAPTSIQANWSCFSVPSICHIPTCHRLFSMPFPMLGMLFPPSVSLLLRALLSQRRLPWSQMLGLVPLTGIHKRSPLIILISGFNYTLLCGIIWFTTNLEAACKWEPCIFILMHPWSLAQVMMNCRRSKSEWMKTWRKLHISCHEDHWILSLEYRASRSLLWKLLIICEGTFLGIQYILVERVSFREPLH